MYRYFAAKEDLFLELLLPDSEAWECGAAEHFGPRVWDPREFAKEWTDVCLPHERMLQLLAIRYAVPEKNCSVGPRGLALARLPRLGSTPSSEW